jgi:hypothetical protein
MPLIDESDEQSNNRCLPEGWQVVSNPTRKPVPPDDELKKLIHDQQRRTEPIARKKYRRLEPLDAA